ncbi:MAG: hypothetical protein WCC30_17930 [Candidatus Dormiibacterota bacterium]
MSNRLQKGPTAEPALQGAISKRSVIVAVLLPAEAAAAPAAKLNAHPRLTRERLWNG